MMRFFGVKDITTVVVEGHNQFLNKAEEIIQEGIERAAKNSNNFLMLGREDER